MIPIALKTRRVMAGCLLLTAACADTPSGPGAEAIAPPSFPALQAFECVASTTESTVRCAPPGGLADGPSTNLIVGGQGEFVTLRSDSVTYDSATAAFSFTVSVKNLLPQALGTLDGTTPDTGDVKVFFHSAPTVNRGSGAVAIVNADGIGTFTGSAQPFYRYGGILDPQETSSSKRWEFAVPPTAITFVFAMYVAAAVPHPSGWLEIVQGDTIYLPRGRQLEIGSLALSPLGRTRSAAVSWSIADSSVATLNSSGPGKATIAAGLNPGETLIIAASDQLADSAVLIVGIPPLVHVSAGLNQTCGLDAEGRAFCWGASADGALGRGVASNIPFPLHVFSSGIRYAELGAGEQFACGRASAGQTYCWGDNSQGQLGGGFAADSARPSAVSQAGADYVQLAVGSRHACGLTSTGQAFCWGSNSLGQLGNGNTSRSPVPVGVLQGGLTFVEIAAGAENTCALTATDLLYCWGAAILLGRERDPFGSIWSSVPVPVEQDGRAFTSVALGIGINQNSDTACAIGNYGQAYCWGDNFYGNLGDGSTTGSYTPVGVQQGGLAYLHVSPGTYHTCALAITGEGYCWGGNTAGQVGNGTISTTPSLVPGPVTQGPDRYVQLDAGSLHTCAVTNAGDVFCWGANSAGQLGGGSFTQSPIPAEVLR